MEYRVREVLEEKLAVILEEFGVDKTGDVLDSAEAGVLFDRLTRKRLSAQADRRARRQLAERLRAEAAAARAATSILPTGEALDSLAFSASWRIHSPIGLSG